MANPRLLLLDEVSLGLAPVVIKELYEALPQIRSAGATVLLVEQNIDLGLSVANRCAVMEKGAIVHEGTPREFHDEAVLKEYLAL
jgi:branched-chain amino acid transport system ATP-binding protein